MSASGNGAWRTIRGFILWSHERGTIQYDVMVTLILLFVFFSPRLIDFNDRPVARNPHATGVVVYGNGAEAWSTKSMEKQCSPVTLPQCRVNCFESSNPYQVNSASHVMSQ